MIRKLFTFAIALILMASSQQAQASHLSGAEFGFVHLGGNDYEISLYLYRDCAGINSPSSVSVNMTSANCALSNTIVLPQLGTPTLVTAIPGGQTTCQGGTIQGYQKFTYRDTITMPAQCSDWLFGWSSCCRNAAITNLVNPSSHSMYIESSFDNTIVNNSPTYFVEPIFYGSMGTNFSVALGGNDPDGDQLLFRLQSPLSDATTPIAFTTGLSVAQPLEIFPGTVVTFSNTTGQFNCVLAQGAQVVVFDVIVDEYRAGQLIASHRRTMQLLPLNLGGHSMTNPNAGNVGGGSIVDAFTFEYNNPSQPFSFSLTFTDNDAADVITFNSMYSSIVARFPAATITPVYPGMGQNILRLDVSIPNPQPAIFNVLLEENGFLQHSFSYELRDATATGVGAIEDEKSFIKVYPNPMEIATTFEILEGNYQELNLQIFDMAGRSIHTQTVQGVQQIQFNRGDIPAGIYLYEIQADGQLLQADLLEIK